LEFSSILWNPYFKMNINKIENIHRLYSHDFHIGDATRDG